MTSKHIEVPPLGEAEQYIMLQKGTEPPGTGEYLHNNTLGTYYCRQCGSALYYSHHKFESGCGWPSFDDAIPGAVKRVDDVDGIRTEIICAHCNGHLGHVFVGERITEKNTRHCVNSLSMKFVPEQQSAISSDIYEEAIVGGGCFWCIEAGLQRVKGVLEIHAGYAGGKRQFPTYEHICTGCTGHIEVVRVRFDPVVLSYETLLKVFFTLHDPTSRDKQGGDEGEQYRSVIFFVTKQQYHTATSLIDYLHHAGMYPAPIVTEVRPLDVFWIAEGYHQNYYNQHRSKPYCHIVISPKLAKLREVRSSLLQ